MNNLLVIEIYLRKISMIQDIIRAKYRMQVIVYVLRFMSIQQFGTSVTFLSKPLQCVQYKGIMVFACWHSITWKRRLFNQEMHFYLSTTHTLMCYNALDFNFVYSKTDVHYTRYMYIDIFMHGVLEDIAPVTKKL